MWPVLYHAPAPSEFAVHTYGLLVLVAFILAFALAHHRTRQVGISLDRLVPVYAAAAVGGLLGARVLYAIAVDLPNILERPADLLACSGLAFYGGVIGGGAGVILAAGAMRMPAWKLLDALAPALVLGLGLGRLGCLFAGCCHGAPVELTDAHALLPDGMVKGQVWLSASFPYMATEFHPGGVCRILFQPLYPTQLWSSAAGIGLAGLLSAMWRFRRFDGQIVATMFVVEPILRFAIELFRADHRGYMVSFAVSEEAARWLPGLGSAGEDLAVAGDGLVQVGLTTSQGLGLVMIAVGLGVLAMRRGSGIAEEIPIVDEDLA